MENEKKFIPKYHRLKQCALRLPHFVIKSEIIFDPILTEILMNEIKRIFLPNTCDMY